MRHLQIIILLLAVLFANSCKIFEDNSNCKSKTNLAVNFGNFDDDGNDIYDRTIDRIDVFLFSQDDILLLRRTIDDSELAERKATFSLDPGTYRIVCWGNAKANTLFAIDLGDNLENGAIEKQVNKDEVVENGNPIYYAPFNNEVAKIFTVTKNEMTDVELNFRCAHIKLSFMVKNYIAPTGDGSQPFIEVCNLYPKYDFKMHYLPTPPLNYIQQAVPLPKRGEPTNIEAKAVFNTPRFENDNPIIIKVWPSNHTGAEEPLKTLILKDELAKKGIDVTSIDELNISFLVDFGGGADVSISITGWGHNPLDPDIK